MLQCVCVSNSSTSYFQYGVYGVAFVGLAVALRSVRPVSTVALLSCFKPSNVINKAENY